MANNQSTIQSLINSLVPISWQANLSNHAFIQLLTNILNAVYNPDTVVIGGSTTADYENGGFPDLQVQGTDTNSAIGIARWQSGNTPGPKIYFGKSSSNTPGVYTAVQAGNEIGRIFFGGADGTNPWFTEGAEIRAEVDGSVSSGIVPGRLIIATTNSSGVTTTAAKITSDQIWTFSGPIATNASFTTALTNYTVQPTDSAIVFNTSGTVTVTLPNPATRPGRWLSIKTLAAQQINSASSNVDPITGGGLGSLILLGTVGNACVLQSNGTFWETIVANNVNGQIVSSTNFTTSSTNYVVQPTDSAIVFNALTQATISLPSASTSIGRWLSIKTIANQGLVSTAVNVDPLAGGGLSSVVLGATAGKWCYMQSNGTFWEIMMAN